MGWACGVYGWGEGMYRVLLGKPEGRRPLGRPRLRWVDNIRMDLQEVGYGYMDWIGLAQDRDRWRTLVSAVMNLRIPWNAGNFLTSCNPVSFSRRTLHHGVSMEYSFEDKWSKDYITTVRAIPNVFLLHGRAWFFNFFLPPHKFLSPLALNSHTDLSIHMSFILMNIVYTCICNQQ